MATVQNMLPAGSPNSQGALLPSLRQGADLVTRIRTDLERIDALVSSITTKTRSASFGGGYVNSYAVAGEVGSGGRGSGGGGGTTAIGMPNPFVGGGGGPGPSLGGGGGGGMGGGGGPAAGTPQGGHNVLRDIIARGASVGLQSGMANAQSYYQTDLMYNRMRLYQGGNFSDQLNMPWALNQGMSVGGRAGFFSTADRNAAISVAMNTGNLNPSASYLQGQAMTGILTGQSATQIAQSTQGLASNPLGILQMRAAGIQTMDKSGNMLPLNQIAQNVFRVDAAGGKYTNAKTAAADFSTFGALRRAFQQMGFTDEQITNQIAPLAVAQADTGGGDLTRLNDPKMTAALKKAGFFQTNIATAEKRTRQADQRDALLYPGRHNGLDAANDSATMLSKAFNELITQVSGLRGVIGGIQGGTAGLGTTGPSGSPSGIGQLGTSLINDAVTALIMGRVAGGKGVIGRLLGFGGGPGGGGGGGLTLGADALGGASLLGGSGLWRGLLSRVAVPVAGGVAAQQAIKHVVHGRGGNMLGDAAAGAGIGASVGLLGGPLDPISVPVGAGVGAGAGFIMGGGGALIQHGLSSAAHGVGSFLSSGGGFFGDARSNTGSGSSSQHKDSGVSGTINAQNLLSFAEQQIGIPYSWGGGGVSGPGRGFNQGANTVGFDCSSFVQYVFAHFGVMLPRTTYDQVKCGVSVDPKNAMPGDLLFFGPEPHHVGIYLGNNQMINAPHTGTNVRIDSASPSSASYIRRVTTTVGAASGTAGGNGKGQGGLNSDQAHLQDAINRVAGALGISPYQVAGGGGVTSNTVTSNARGSAPSAPGTVSGNVALAKQMAAARGWSGAEWNALYAVWNQESSFNDHASNGTYYGIPQGPIGQLQGKTAKEQITWGLNYIANRYHDPEGALAHKHATDSTLGSHAQYAQPGGWYDKGAWNLSKDETARVHQGEMILPKDFAEAVRVALGPGQRPVAGGGGARSVVINVHPTKVDRTEAEHLAKMVKEVLEEDHHHHQIGAA